MNTSKAFVLFFKRSFDWKGTSSRREFWLGVLPNAIIMCILILLLIISLFCSSKRINPFSIAMIMIFAIFCIVEILPSISLIIRRMHDIGKSGYYIWILFIPIAGLVWYIYLVTRPTGFFKNNHNANSTIK